MKMPHYLLRHNSQHFLDSDVVVLLHEEVVLFRDEEGSGVVFEARGLQLLVEVSFVGEVDTALDVVVELTWTDVSVVGGSVLIRP